MTMDLTVNANTNPAIRELDRLGNKIEEIQAKFSDGFNKMNLAATALGATLLALGASVARFADDITDVADANGLATAEVLAFQSALASSGGKADNVAQALQRLSNAVDDANNGNMKAVGSFAKLGVSIQDLGSMSQSEIREKLLTNLSKIPDAMQRNALATEFFGKALIGVDLQKLIQEERDARAEAEKYAPALETAGQAFDNLLKISKQIKLAFAEAFEPLFKVIGGLKVDVDLLVVGFRAVGAALVAITAAGVIRGVLALKDAFVLLNAVTSKNPLIALGSAALGIAAYIGLTKDATDATKELNKETEKPKKSGGADQSGLYDILKKQQASITKSSDELQRGFDIAKSKYDLDLKGLSLLESEKDAAVARAKIEQDAAKAKADAQSAFDALDKNSQNLQRQFLADTLKGIDERAAKEKTASDARLANLARERDLAKQLQDIANAGAAGSKAVFDAQMKFSNSRIIGINDEIAAESKLAAVNNLRADLLSRVSRLSEKEKGTAISAITSITDNVDNLKGSFEDVSNTMKGAFANTQLSPQAKDLLTREPFAKFIENGREAAKVSQQISDQSRTFAYGWEQAFKAYSREADNAAAQAQQLFSNLTKGIEDAFVNFAKTGKLSFKELLSSVAEQILRSNIKQLLSNLFTPEGSSSSIFNTLISGAKSLLGFANGGIIPTNKPVVVGERGPELLMGAAGNRVVPNEGLGTTVVYNINAVDAASFKSLVARDPAFIHAVAQQGARSLPSRR